MWKVKKNGPPLDVFEQWCEFEEPPSDRKLDFDQHKKDMKDAGSYSEETIAQTFHSEVQKAGELQAGINVNSYSNSQPILDVLEIYFSMSFTPSDLAPDANSHIHGLTLGNTNQLKITGGVVKTLYLQTAQMTAELRECCIGELFVHPKYTVNLQLENCWVGRLTLDANCVKNLDMKGGSIRTIECPPPDGDNPFTGSVSFQDVNFPTSPKQSRLIRGPQSYRNMRAHFENLENAPAANLMRSLELTTERHYDDHLFTRAVSWTYGTFADYGASPGRPLLWALGLYVLTAGLIFAFDGGDIGTAASDYFGWRASLADMGFGGELKRSLILPVQSFVNPFGVFGVRKLVVAATGLGHIGLSIQGLVTDILIAMSLFGIRRRFKLH